jgi:predicted nucleic acid-binding protein
VTLIDTSVWIDHFRHGHAGLIELLQTGSVHTHPFVIGELACDNLRDRANVLALLTQLPQVPQATHEEVLTFFEMHRLMGKGLGLIDMHLLAAARLSGTALLTSDNKFKSAAESIGASAV